MRTIIKKSLQSLLLVPVLALGVSVVTPVVQPMMVHAQSDAIQKGVTDTGNEDTGTATLPDLIELATTTLLMIVGAICVIMIIYGGFKYVTSSGDSSNVTAAKNTILYAVIGLVVALLAYAIIQWVITTVTSTGGSAQV